MRQRNKYKFGNTSKERMAGVSRYIIMCAERVIKCSPIDIGVPLDGGGRDVKRQNWIFSQGFSSCDGVKKLSNHQLKNDNGEYKALDLVPYISGLGFCYDAYGRFGIIGALMLEAWDELKEEGKIPEGLYLHWGGLWKPKDKKSLGWDMAHFEERDYEQIERL